MLHKISTYTKRFISISKRSETCAFKFSRLGLITAYQITQPYMGYRRWAIRGGICRSNVYIIVSKTVACSNSLIKTPLSYEI